MLFDLKTPQYPKVSCLLYLIFLRIFPLRSQVDSLTYINSLPTPVDTNTVSTETPKGLVLSLRRKRKEKKCDWNWWGRRIVIPKQVVPCFSEDRASDPGGLRLCSSRVYRALDTFFIWLPRFVSFEWIFRDPVSLSWVRHHRTHLLCACGP